MKSGGMKETHEKSPSKTKEPKLTPRRAQDRGQADHGWLQARFTFSFADYFDPQHIGFQALRVMNNDQISPMGGFPLHPHRDMEIFTYVISGQLQHQDSLGNGSIIQAGDLQYMSAGSGIRHSEFNPSKTEPTLLYQIWLKPNEKGGEPRYAEKALKENHLKNELKLLFASDGMGDATPIRQNAAIYFGRLEKGQSLAVPASPSRPHAWVQTVSGELSIIGTHLNPADGLQIENAPNTIEVEAQSDASFIVFRLAEESGN